MALFEPLVKIGEDLAVIPALAKSWTVNDEHTVYTF
jgi:ABC-type transport system substrate-binding protein